MCRRLCLLSFTSFLILGVSVARAGKEDADGFVSLFNGKDFTGWIVPPGDNGHWKIVDGVIDYDARSESPQKEGNLGAKGKHLWTEKSYGDFTMKFDWRFKAEQPGCRWNIWDVQLDGSDKKGPDGKVLRPEIANDYDSGIYLRGNHKSQVNMWMWPIGSGEVFGYRRDPKSSPAVRAGVTPKKHADKPAGEWNHMEITMKGDRLWVNLNGEDVITNAQLPGVPESGPIAIQHHGAWSDAENRWTGPPSLIQVKNVKIKELK